MKTVLAMITKDSYEELGHAFIETLKRSLQVPYELLILVDDSVKPTTANIVKKFAEEHNIEVIVSKSRYKYAGRSTRASARQTAIEIFFENTSAEWLMFLDDDAWLEPGWWHEAKEAIRDTTIGEVWGPNLYPDWSFWGKYVKMLYGDVRGYLISQFKKRGGLHDTLLRREAIKDIFIPSCLHIYEDAFVHMYVLCKGWRFKVLNKGVIHVNPYRRLSRHLLDHSVMFALIAGIEEQNVITHLARLLKTVIGIPIVSILGFILSSSISEVKSIVALQVDKLLYRYAILKKFREAIEMLSRLNVRDVCEIMQKPEELRVFAKILCKSGS